MAEDKVINLDDINYAVYKIGEWKNHYEINQIGLSKESEWIRSYCNATESCSSRNGIGRCY